VGPPPTTNLLNLRKWGEKGNPSFLHIGKGTSLGGREKGGNAFVKKKGDSSKMPQNKRDSSIEASSRFSRKLKSVVIGTRHSYNLNFSSGCNGWRTMGKRKLKGILYSEYSLSLSGSVGFKKRSSPRIGF